MRKRLLKRPVRWVLSAIVGVMVVTLAGRALGSDTGSGSSGSGGDRPRPHPAGFTEGMGTKRCSHSAMTSSSSAPTTWATTSTGPGHEGDGLKSERDPGEFQQPAMGPPGSPCIVGETDSGSLPKIDPTGQPAEQAEKIWVILPFFEAPRIPTPRSKS